MFITKLKTDEEIDSDIITTPEKLNIHSDEWESAVIKLYGYAISSDERLFDKS